MSTIYEHDLDDRANPLMTDYIRVVAATSGKSTKMVLQDLYDLLNETYSDSETLITPNYDNYIRVVNSEDAPRRVLFEDLANYIFENAPIDDEDLIQAIRDLGWYELLE